MMVLARLLIPKDFGLVGMVTAATGILGLLKDAGLSAASVQRASITRAQTSTLFWINLAVGGLLATFCVGLAPALAAFYGDRRLFWVTVVSGTGFILNGAAVQHQAMLQRAMRFGMIATINIISLILSIAIGVGMAMAGGDTGRWWRWRTAPRRYTCWGCGWLRMDSWEAPAAIGNRLCLNTAARLR